MTINISEADLQNIDRCPLLKYLDSQREGGQFESSDSFSINFKAAQEKLGKFALPRQAAWILKFLQCANTLNCELISIKICRNAIEVWLPSTSFPELYILKERLETLAPQDEAQEHLFSALAALKNLSGDTVVSDGKALWSLERELIEECPQNDSSTGLRCTYRPPQHGFWDWLRARLGLTTTLITELQSYGYASPVPVYVDGALLFQAHNSIVLVNGALTDRTDAHLEVGGYLLTGHEDRYEVFSNWAQSKSLKFSCLARIEHQKAALGSNISVDWLRSGVVIKREEHSVKDCDHIHSRTLVSAEDLKLDLTGFDIKEDEESRQRRRRSACFTWHALTDLQRRLRDEEQWSFYLEHNLEKPPFEPQTGSELVKDLSALLEVLTSPAES